MMIYVSGSAVPEVPLTLAATGDPTILEIKYTTAANAYFRVRISESTTTAPPVTILPPVTIADYHRLYSISAFLKVGSTVATIFKDYVEVLQTKVTKLVYFNTDVNGTLDLTMEQTGSTPAAGVIGVTTMGQTDPTDITAV